MPLTQKQRGMIGERRCQEALRAQLEGRGMHEMPIDVPRSAKMSYVASEAHRNSSVDSETWSAHAVRSVAVGTYRSGNHVCRPNVCHKERLVKKGFCRMYF